MTRNSFSPLGISLRNIAYRKFRAVCLVGTVIFLSFVLIAGSLLTVCLKNGIGSISARLGADALFVPYGYEQYAEGALLRGEPSSFYFDGDTARQLLILPDISEATPQLFIASFDSPHCSVKVQMIGYDAQTDFLLAPWLNDEVPGGPGDSEVIVGSKINGNIGDKLTFFSHEYIVVGKLKDTGMGFDTSAFINLDMAQIALKEYARLGGENVPDGDDVISSIAINVAPGIDLPEFAKNIRLGYRDLRVSVIETQTMISGMSANLDALISVIGLLSVLLWVLAAGVLALIFTLSINERRREFGIYRALGASKTKLAAIILSEAAVTGAIGAAIGLALVSFVYFLFEPLLSISIDLPYLRPSGGTIAGLLVGGFVLSLATGQAAAAFSALRIGKIATAAIIKEGS
jgi:putative ABC transport system permease protein